jgi:hypothetical protein
MGAAQKNQHMKNQHNDVWGGVNTAEKKKKVAAPDRTGERERERKASRDWKSIRC